MYHAVILQDVLKSRNRINLCLKTILVKTNNILFYFFSGEMPLNSEHWMVSIKEVQ